VTTTLTTVC